MTDIRRTKLLTQPVNAAPDRLEAYRVEFAPGQLGGPHLHPGPSPGTWRAGTTGTVRYDPDYLGVHRDDGVVYVDITMRAGRTDEQKKALYARLAELAGKYADNEPRNVFVTIHENQFSDWSFGNGIGQYLERNQ